MIKSNNKKARARYIYMIKLVLELIKHIIEFEFVKHINRDRVDLIMVLFNRVNSF